LVIDRFIERTLFILWESIIEYKLEEIRCQ
jgi:hypothetical protein